MTQIWHEYDTNKTEIAGEIVVDLVKGKICTFCTVAAMTWSTTKAASSTSKYWGERNCFMYYSYSKRQYSWPDNRLHPTHVIKIRKVPKNRSFFKWIRTFLYVNLLSNKVIWSILLSFHCDRFHDCSTLVNSNRNFSNVNIYALGH